VHKDLDKKEECHVDCIVVDWQTGMEWVVAPYDYNQEESNWYEIHEWAKKLDAFHGGGWRMPTVLQAGQIRIWKNSTNTFEVPYAMCRLGLMGIWCSDETKYEENAYFMAVGWQQSQKEATKIRSKGDRVSVLRAAVRPLIRKNLPEKFSWYENDPKLSLK